MSEEQARSLTFGVGFAICAVIAALAFGDAAVHVVLGVFICGLLWDRVALSERADEASDLADQALGRIEAVEAHLSGLEPASSGRHVRRAA